MGLAAMPARLGAALGARLLVSCSAVGAVDPSLVVGSWVLIEDHLNFMGRNPLEGVCDGAGPAFVDLSRAYRTDLFEELSLRLGGRGWMVRRGVLAAFPGPSYETPAEVRMARLLGASVVGMSTVPEAVWARYLGLDVLAWGRVSNAAAGVTVGTIDHDEVLRQSESGAAEAAVVVEQSVQSWQGAER
jgi:purine-nucleoside phosphorylase